MSAAKPDAARALALFVKQRGILEIAAALATDEAGAWAFIRAPRCAHDRAKLCTACTARSKRLAYGIHAPQDERPGHDGSRSANERA